jgi:hypothetical protein
VFAIELSAIISAAFEYATRHSFATLAFITSFFVALKKTGKAITAFDRFQIDYRIERRKKINKLRSVPYVPKPRRPWRTRFARLTAILLIRLVRRISPRQTANLVSETSKPRLESSPGAPRV